MGKKHVGPKRRKVVEEKEASDSEISVEEGDIEALARSGLKEGEKILGEGMTAQEVESRGICHAPLILQKLADIEYKVPKDAKRIPWVDTLVIDGWREVPKDIKAKDGVKLEGAFIEIANDAVKEAYRRLRVMKVPSSRPSDFYAEMMRTDAQMFKVRERAAEEQRRMKVVDSRKMAQNNKKFAKSIKVNKLMEKAKDKNKTMDEIADWKDKRKQDGRNADEQDLEDILNKGKQWKDVDSGPGQEMKKKAKGPNLKQQAKDKKWGHGGKKKYAKSNDKSSTNDMESSPWGRKGKGKVKGKGKGGGGGGGGKGKSKGKGKGKGGGKRHRHGM